MRLDTAARVGYEVLARSRLIGLETPNAMFRVAAERNLEAELSDVVRHESMRMARQLGLNAELFVNTHPAELHRACPMLGEHPANEPGSFWLRRRPA